MRIHLRDIVINIPDDPKKISAYQYTQIRICAAKLSTLTNNLPDLRQKIADIIAAIQVDNKEVAIKQLELLYYSAYLATDQQDLLLECFSWITCNPNKAAQMTDEDIRNLSRTYILQGITHEQVEKAVSFFLTKLGLN